jgi:hypothetical protein
MSEGDGLHIMEATHDAVRSFATAELRSLTRRAIYRLQRIPATGIYGDDYAFKTMWDEYCHESQSGPFFDDSWGDLVSRTLEGLVDQVPRETAVLLTILAIDATDEDYGTTVIGTVNKDRIVAILGASVAEEAGARDLERFEIY